MFWIKKKIQNLKAGAMREFQCQIVTFMPAQFKHSSVFAV